MGAKSPKVWFILTPHLRVTWYSTCACQKWAWSGNLKPKGM